jgi:hypothetical protein
LELRIRGKDQKERSSTALIFTGEKVWRYSKKSKVFWPGEREGRKI